VRAFGAIENLSEEFLLSFSKIMKLSFAQDLAIGLGLLTSPEPLVKEEGFYHSRDDCLLFKLASS
jgi:hypothetical protein